MNTSAPQTTIARVEIEKGEHLAVWPIWTNVDRARGTGYAVKDMRMAKRLERAMLAGVVFYDAQIKTDVNGKTYVSAPSRVLGRMINADLNRLGF